MKIGIIICDRYRDCAGGKCFRAMRNREGAFDLYPEGEDLEIVGYTSCGGCPGGNIEYAPAEMIKNGAEVIHLATGLVVGYPPCPRLSFFKEFIEKHYGVKVVIGTHPIPQKYFITHSKLGTWDGERWQTIIEPTICNEEMRKQYD
ncbi:MAG: CGGC domain-containing protein [Candidatus Thermoplasmatota archaeon]|nr:CGGC domain-containing protein [Candidatus Thermoplasmatota archaeon]